MLDPHEVLALLLEGNQRWVRGERERPRQTVQRRKEVASHQDPFAVVFSCIDSRVPPEIVFDCGIGDLFVIRTGGEALDDLVVLGSPEFGPSGYSSTRLIVVLGHERCGAVIAAIKSIQSGIRAPGHIAAVDDACRPADEAPLERPGGLAEERVSAQVRLTASARE